MCCISTITMLGINLKGSTPFNPQDAKLPCVGGERGDPPPPPPARSLCFLAGNSPLQEETYSVNVYMHSGHFAALPVIPHLKEGTYYVNMYFPIKF